MTKVDEGSSKPSYDVMASKGSNLHGHPMNGDELDDMVVLADDYVINKSGAYSKHVLSTPRVENGKYNAKEGSRFVVLIDNDDVAEASSSIVPATISSLPRVLVVGSSIGQDLVISCPALSVNKNSAYFESNPNKRKKGSAKVVGTIDVISIVSAKEVEVIAHKNVQSSNQYMVISNVEHYDGNKSPAGGKIVKSRGYVGKGVKETLANQLQLVEQTSHGHTVVPSSTVNEQVNIQVLGGTDLVTGDSLKPQDAPSIDGHA
ncbi:hypothetical protein V6N12_074568 [Hibiscus sabdariffa]|uniref:Uncharacterized protein n=1 Tax=Hibiscus sabdariffa TaxID=183260 RepID=A0ABR2AJM3_9ROSI